MKRQMICLVMKLIFSVQKGIALLSTKQNQFSIWIGIHSLFGVDYDKIQFFPWGLIELKYHGFVVKCLYLI